MTHKENVLRLADIAPNPSGPEADPDWCARAEFLANMNHDLRTPLNAVIGFAQIIESEIYGKIGPQYLEYARHIQESGYDLLGKIEDLLKAAETEREMVAGELEEMDALHPTRQLAIAD